MTIAQQIAALLEDGQWWTLAALCAYLQAKPSSVATAIWLLRQDGLIQRGAAARDHGGYPRWYRWRRNRKAEAA